MEMIHSMTGFGKATVKSKYGTIGVEAKSLNHKFFEPSIKLPNGLASFEDKVKKLLQGKLRRGKIYLSVTSDDKAKEAASVSIDTKIARAYYHQLNILKRSLKLKGEVRLDQFIALPGVLAYGPQKIDASKTWIYVRKAIVAALDNLLKDREKEGRALHRDLAMRAKEIKSLLNRTADRSDLSVFSYRKHLSKKIGELTGSQPVDKGRLEQEVALFAKNCDISEELTRMRSHLSVFEESIGSSQEVGKKLDFIAQEMHREINTICAKTADFKISKWAIQIKSEIEKIREQVKNVE